MNQNLHQNRSRVVVSMGYDNITTSIDLATGYGAILPDPSIAGSYDLVWWNASDYLSPADDPSAEVVKCIARLGDTLIVMRSQQQTLALPKNISGKLYNMALLPDNIPSTLSYYNVPQIHGKTKHDATTIDGGTALPIGQLPAHGLSAHTGTIGTWASIDKTTSNIADITTKSHGSLTDGIISGTVNSHANIDTHIAATGTSVHGLGTLATQSGTFSGTSSGTNTGDNAANSSIHYIGTTAVALNRASAALTLTGVSISGGSITGITDLAVADGGTGNSTAVAYSPLCGGTTTTAPLQSVPSVGTAGQILTSNGAGALPTFQTPLGGGLSAQELPTPILNQWVDEPYLRDSSEATFAMASWVDAAATKDITYDLGSIKNVLFHLNGWTTAYTGGSGSNYNSTTIRVRYSLDNINWKQHPTIIWANAKQGSRVNAEGIISGFVIGRYLNIRMDSTSSFPGFPGYGNGEARVFDIVVVY